jgi:AAA domain, putative AbiEii toxin, Type IV TA system
LIGDAAPVGDAMLKSLRLSRFTAFPEADVEFCKELNVIAGENGTGKTHLLKVPYVVLAASWEESKRAPNSPAKTYLQPRLADKLRAVMRPDTLGRLARRQPGVQRSEVECRFTEKKLDIAFSLTTRSEREVTIDRLPSAWATQAPVYIPTRELLTIYPGFVSLYETAALEFEETWRDTCLLLGAPLVRGPREGRVKQLLEPLEQAMGGNIVLEKSGRFYLNVAGQGTMEMPLVAEGFRKLAMIARLIANGALLDKGYLFWDEPEANLNAAIIKKVAPILLHLAASGIQVFVATHSLFLMRELDILLRTPAFAGRKARFIGLTLSSEGTVVRQGDSIDDIGEIAALQEELSQSDRYLAAEEG